jgi:hypothetical protein
MLITSTPIDERANRSFLDGSYFDPEVRVVRDATPLRAEQRVHTPGRPCVQARNQVLMAWKTLA